MQKNLRKLTAAFCLGTAVLALVPAPSLAEAAAIPVINQQEKEIVPYLLYIADAESKLSISNRTATINGSVIGVVGSVTKVNIVAELQEKDGASWTTIDSWSDTQNGPRATINTKRTVTAGKTYRVKTTVTAWAGTASETQVVYSDQKTA